MVVYLGVNLIKHYLNIHFEIVSKHVANLNKYFTLPIVFIDLPHIQNKKHAHTFYSDRRGGYAQSGIGNASQRLHS